MFDLLGGEPIVVPLTLYTDSFVIKGQIRTRQARITDILNHADEDFLVLSDVVIDPGERRVSHIVVEDSNGGARLVPAELLEGAAPDGPVVLSCTVGLRKPDPRIYRLACERLDVRSDECLFVGDGANDELAGAERVGMRAVCVLPPGREEPLWPEAHGWEPTIGSLGDVLRLV